MFITPSRFQWNKTKDMVHFYVMLGVIPVGLLVFYTNVFIGPATLSPIPENYSPKHWEYHRVRKWSIKKIQPLKLMLWNSAAPNHKVHC